MLTFLSSMLCTSKIHLFSFGNYLGTSLIIGNLMIIRVTNVRMDMVRVRVASCPMIGEIFGHNRSRS
jgi:hypothetical protein